ncbi:MAG: hypothetical protein K5886_11510 [Lachnospiraceae bacterium]|nr:hypothetical protein [Lachnospiraceae bacterium]
MKKRLLIITVMALFTAFVISGCAGSASSGQGEAAEDKREEEKEEVSYIGNPWSDISEEEAREACANLFKAPEGAKNPVWSIMKDVEEGYGPMLQLNFEMPEYKDVRFVARAQKTGKEEDISGAYYEWNTSDEGISSKLGGKDIPVKSYRYKDDMEMADLISWYDKDTGISCCLLATAEDLDGFDIQAIAEAMYDGDGSDEAEMYGDFLQFQSGVTDFKDYDEVISYLKQGQGYALVDVMGSSDKVLLITELVFEADKSACEASSYVMSDGKPQQMTLLTGNGSAYPLRIGEDGIIYGGDNHTYETYVVSDIGSIMCKDYVVDDIGSGDGEFTGYLRPGNDYEHDEDFTGGREEFDKLISEREKQPVIEFTVIGEDSGSKTGDFDPSKVYIEQEDLFDVDTEGCDTLTQIVDRLEEGRGYVNVNIGQSGALLISSGTYKYDDDTDAAIDARIFDYDDDGKVIDIGSVCAGGTAYPLSVKDDILYVGGNHFMRLYTIRDHELVIIEEVYVEYDGEGNATYHLRKENEDFSKYSSKEAESRFDELFAQLEDVQIIGFATVGSAGE